MPPDAFIELHSRFERLGDQTYAVQFTFVGVPSEPAAIKIRDWAAALLRDHAAELGVVFPVTKQ